MKPLTVQALEKIGKDWSVAKSTREGRLQHTKDFAQFVADKFGLQNIQNLKPGHIQAYVNDMKERGLANGTMCNRMAHVRELCESIGKPGIIARENEAFDIERGDTRCNPIIENQELAKQIREQIREIAETTGNPKYVMCNAAAELREAFSLRSKESLMSTKVVTIKGIPHLRVEGAKNGKPRDFPITNAKQERAIQIAHAASKTLKSGTGRIIPPKMSLERASNVQRGIWRKFGGTRAAAANMHASRHTGIQEMDRSGMPHGEIQLRVGHGEKRVLNNYIPK